MRTLVWLLTSAAAGAAAATVAAAVAEATPFSWFENSFRTRNRPSRRHGRWLVPQTHEHIELAPCNEVLESFTKAELETYLSGLIEESTQGFLEAAFLKGLFVANLASGVQLRRVCASCAQDMPPSIPSYCQDDVYGSNVLHSGLLVLPTDPNDADTLLVGTHPTWLYTHETNLDDIPSQLWKQNRTIPENIAEFGFSVVWFFLSAASTQQMAVLAPDYMGYGTSSGTVYKGYAFRTSYETSVIPLYYKSKQWIRQESDCASAIGNAVAVAGYSEGGYAAVVVAHALSKQMGVQIIRVHSGGAPYKVASASLLSFARGMDQGTISPNSTHIIALLTTPYSSTYESIANFNQGQDMLTPEARELFADVLSIPFVTTEYVQEVVANATMGTNYSSLLTPTLLTAVRMFLDEGMADPCRDLSATELQDLEVDLICESLLQADVQDTLEDPTAVNFPVEICHSPDDELVTYDNVPNISLNPNLQLVPGVSGSHGQAGGTCFFSFLQYSVGTELATYPLDDEHDERGCAAAAAPTKSPTENGGSGAAVSALWVVALGIVLTYVSMV